VLCFIATNGSGREKMDCSVKDGVAFMWIPGNADDWIKSNISETGDIVRKDYSQYVVILRDPLTRWIDNVVKYTNGNAELEQQVLDDYANTLVYDDNTSLQNTWIVNLLRKTRANIEFCYYDNLAALNTKYNIAESLPLYTSYSITTLGNELENLSMLPRIIKSTYNDDYKLIKDKLGF
jgi:hypothetical protein